MFSEVNRNVDQLRGIIMIAIFSEQTMDSNMDVGGGWVVRVGFSLCLQNKKGQIRKEWEKPNQHKKFLCY